MVQGRQVNMGRGAALLAAFMLLTAPVQAREADDIVANPSADRAVAALEAGLPEKVRAALLRIDAGGRRMLALRAYIRGTRSIDSRWSWTDEEIASYERSEDHEQALAAVAEVKKAFEAENPGYSLHVNTKVRSLDAQIDSWNRNATVGAAASEIDIAFLRWSLKGRKVAEKHVRAFLSGWEPEATVSIAVPGLSPHGRARAFDFQVTKGGKVIAPPSMKSIEGIWDGQGWTEKLNAAVKASNMPFAGPLQRPREPWHYDYSGSAAQVKKLLAKAKPVEPVESEAPAQAEKKTVELSGDLLLPARVPVPRPRPERRGSS